MYKIIIINLRRNIMKIHKKHILVSALVLALGAAVYINWQFSSSPNTKAATKELGAATYVSRDTAATVDESALRSNSLTAGEKLTAARIERTQTQDKALDTAKEILTLADSSDDAKKSAVEQANAIEQRIMTQNSIENILIAKGFSDVLCYVSDSGCTVTVLKSEMQKDSPLIIKDAVLSQLKVSFNDIVIIEL